jgi:hypothetical protein
VTRAAALAELRPTLGKRQADVLSLVRLRPGKTAWELTEIGRYREPNAVRPRLVELAKAGHIVATGNRVCSVSGKMAMTWAIPERREQGELEL